jgi:hypothetical protein
MAIFVRNSLRGTITRYRSSPSHEESTVSETIDVGATPFEDIGQIARPLFFLGLALLTATWVWVRLEDDLAILETPFAQMTLMNFGALLFHIAVTVIAARWWWVWAFSNGPKNYRAWGVAGLAGSALAILLAGILAARR